MFSKIVSRTLGSAACAAPARNFSWWKSVPMASPDPILGISESFKADKDPRKLNLGVGAYRDDQGKPTVLKSVQEAQKRIFEAKLNNEYAPIAGEADFVKHAITLAYGSESAPLKDNRVAAIQSLSGTGALRLAGAFIARFSTPGKLPTVYVPNPTWGNHFPIFNDCGLKTATYRYYKAATKGLDLEGLLADVKAAPEGSVFLFHACAHNPTGVDPREAEWKAISEAVKSRRHFVILDSAYQGFASGDPVKDTFALRQLVQDGHQIAVCQSFAKNFGLYGQRVGAVSFVTDSAAEKEKVESQLKVVARAMYSNPPIAGSRIVSTILGDAALKTQWHADVKEMAERIIKMRSMLRNELQKLGSPHNWQHITDQIGMFAFLGTSPAQNEHLLKKWHVYLLSTGRISVAGVNSGNISYLAQAIHDATTNIRE